MEADSLTAPELSVDDLRLNVELYPPNSPERQIAVIQLAILRCKEELADKYERDWSDRSKVFLHHLLLSHEMNLAKLLSSTS